MGGTQSCMDSHHKAAWPQTPSDRYKPCKPQHKRHQGTLPQPLQSIDSFAQLSSGYAKQNVYCNEGRAASLQPDAHSQKASFALLAQHTKLTLHFMMPTGIKGCGDLLGVTAESVSLPEDPKITCPLPSLPQLSNLHANENIVVREASSPSLLTGQTVSQAERSPCHEPGQWPAGSGQALRSPGPPAHG